MRGGSMNKSFNGCNYSQSRFLFEVELHQHLDYFHLQMILKMQEVAVTVVQLSRTIRSGQLWFICYIFAVALSAKLNERKKENSFVYGQTMTCPHGTAESKWKKKKQKSQQSL